ncbi:MAG TPA: PIN domain-containing protein [Chthoniobacteraceae bacterium]|nr:PIN domain-containing protein [Chthoniobacteraceae bacterium]
MERLIDSTLWVDYFRTQTPAALRAQAGMWIDHEDAVTCWPVLFEVIRGIRPDERRRVRSQLETVSVLTFEVAHWLSAALLGQRCRDRGFTIGPLDLLIATVALAHDAEVISFDEDYSFIAQVEPRLRVQVLTRAL